MPDELETRETSACPHCAEKIAYNIVAKFKNLQRVKMKIEPNKDSMLSAETVGGVLSNLSELMKACAEQVGGTIIPLVEKIESDANGCVSMTLLLATTKHHKPQASRETP